MSLTVLINIVWSIFDDYHEKAIIADNTQLQELMVNQLGV